VNRPGFSGDLDTWLWINHANADWRSVPAPIAKRLGAILEYTWPGSEPPLTAFAAQQLSMAHWFDQREVQSVLQWTPLVSVEAGTLRLAASFN
jgi:hypothetical protein